MTYSAHKSRFDIVAYHAMADLDDHDTWGNAMSMFFDVADVLNMSDVAGDVTPEPFARWQYRPSPCVAVPDLESVAARIEEFSEGELADDYSYGVVSLASALVNEQLTQDDLIYAGNVLDRYTNLLRLAGKDY